MRTLIFLSLLCILAAPATVAGNEKRFHLCPNVYKGDGTFRPIQRPKGFQKETTKLKQQSTKPLKEKDGAHSNE